MTELGDRIRDIVSIELQIDREKITPTATLLDLGMDSVSALNILFAVEETFGLPQIDVAEASRMATIVDLEGVVHRMLEAQPSSTAAGR